MAISANELNPHAYATTPEIDQNLAVLLERMNQVRSAWGHPMIVTSGLRSQSDQQRINPAAPQSKHLLGAACDISDPAGALARWVQDRLQLMADVGLWCEDFRSTPGWVHFQILPPKSGRRVFLP